jgi:hypothetical protein
VDPPPGCSDARFTPLDAGTDAFSGVGDSAGDQRCQQFCPPLYLFCTLVSPTTVKCEKRCK